MAIYQVIMYGLFPKKRKKAIPLVIASSPTMVCRDSWHLLSGWMPYNSWLYRVEDEYFIREVAITINDQVTVPVPKPKRKQ